MNLGETLVRAAAARDAGDAETAEALYRRAVAEAPDEPEPHHHLAALLHRSGRTQEAEAEYRKTLSLAPAAPGTERLLGLLLLSQGRFAEGFARLEARHQLAEYAKPQLPFAEWRGEDVAGKRLLIWPEQGFGDQIQFARFAPVLKAMGAEVTLLCRPGLARLFDQSLGVAVVPASGAIAFPDPDYWVMSCSLAARLGVELETIPNAPYLRAAGPQPARPEGFRIGLAARGNPANSYDRHRSLPPEAEAALRRLPGQVIGLAPQETGARDFADTAAIIEKLDLVIAVDTAVAHLAGAMGKPCWVLLSATGTDWRWLRGRTDCPWYPSLRLYRQEAPDDWTPVLGAVEADLQAMRQSQRFA